MTENTIPKKEPVPTDEKELVPTDEKEPVTMAADDKQSSMKDKDALKLEAALGHKQALSRNYGLFSLTSLGIVIAK